MCMNDPDAIAFRKDLLGLDVPRDDLIRFKKTMSELNKTAKKEAKPNFCCICGDEMTSFCNSHTVPRYCLREIAVDGKLLTTASVVGGNLINAEVGISEAATFKRVCKKCDTEYFKLYETPDALRSEPTHQMLGQIAAKNLLREISKGRLELGLETALGDKVSAEYRTMMTVRSVDIREDEKALKEALCVGRKPRSSNAYHLVHYRLLPYVTPFAFQQMISPIADFVGGVINNSYNPSVNYKIEPIHICVLPTKGATAVIVFRNEKAKRYREFERQFRGLEENDKLLALVKLIFAYSEDVLLSKLLPSTVLSNESLKTLVKMSHNYFGFGNSIEEYKKAAYQSALTDFAINNMPDPPNLLLERFSLCNLN